MTCPNCGGSGLVRHPTLDRYEREIMLNASSPEVYQLIRERKQAEDRLPPFVFCEPCDGNGELEMMA